MGVPESSGSQQTSAMKIFFFALAVLAAYAVADAVPNADANADADADPWYRSYYGHGLGYYGGYRGYYGYGLGHYGLGLGYRAYGYPVTTTRWGGYRSGSYWG